MVREILDKFLWITEETFTRKLSQAVGKDKDGNELPWHIKRCLRKQYNDRRGSQLENIDGKKCQQIDYCGQRVREIYKLVHDFEEVFNEGSIQRLSDYNDSWKKDIEFH